MWEKRRVSDLTDFFEVAADVLPSTAGSNVAYWFRGQSNAQWQLEPSFMRTVKHRRVAPEQAIANLESLEELQRLLATNVQEALALEVALLKLHL